MCFWIFHDWLIQKAFGERRIDMLARQCVKCGKKEVSWERAPRQIHPDSVNKALNWMKEEVIK